MVSWKERTIGKLSLIAVLTIMLGGYADILYCQSLAYIQLLLNQSPAFTELVINDVDADEVSGTLSIKGHNFDRGYIPEVIFDYNKQLTVISFTANEIIAVLPVFDLANDFVISVKSGDSLENYDFYSVMQDDEDHVSIPNQLVIFSSSDDDNGSQNNMNIMGQNFNDGYWLPDVRFNDIAIDVDIAKSNSELLSLVLPPEAVAALSDPIGGVVLTVKTGSSFQQYDAYEMVNPRDFDDQSSSGTEFDCSRRNKVPSSGEHWCNTAGQTLRWKTGPIRTAKIPHYYELTEDYEIDIKKYFSDYKALPNRRSYSKKEEIFNMLVGLLDEMSLCSEFSTRSNKLKWDYLSFVDGKMKIKKGYRWDGESRPGRTLGYHMRAAFIHDTFYDLIRLKYIPCTDFTTERRKDYQQLADTVFYFIAREAGQGSIGARSAWRVLRLGGWSKAKLDIEETKFLLPAKKPASWRFHTLADARVWFDNVPMSIDNDGNKFLEVTCATKSDEIEFDAGYSRPIAEQPQKGIFQDDVHVTTWEWSLNNVMLEPQHMNEVGLLLDRNELKTKLTVNELLQKGLPPDQWGTIKLTIDAGNDTSMGYYENSDSVSIRIDIDDEPPVITGLTESVNQWPPNHKYITFTVADFVSSVTDNCSSITIDDLVIQQVTSNEADEDKGDGHTYDDIVIAPDRKSVKLRIERQGKSEGRLYTIFVQAIDNAGNERVEPFQVYIPHDMH